MRRGRIGRPGLLGTMARTAVITGTAQATSNAVARRASRRDAEQQTYVEQAPQQNYYAPPQAVPPPEQNVGEDLTSKLRQLAQLHEAGALTDGEFVAAKAQLLG